MCNNDDGDDGDGEGDQDDDADGDGGPNKPEESLQEGPRAYVRGQPKQSLVHGQAVRYDRLGFSFPASSLFGWPTRGSSAQSARA